jgi:hypothetical protein
MYFISFTILWSWICTLPILEWTIFSVKYTDWFIPTQILKQHGFVSADKSPFLEEMKMSPVYTLEDEVELSNRDKKVMHKWQVNWFGTNGVAVGQLKNMVFLFTWIEDWQTLRGGGSGISPSLAQSYRIKRSLAAACRWRNASPSEMHPFASPFPISNSFHPLHLLRRSFHSTATTSSFTTEDYFVANSGLTTSQAPK